MVNLTKIRWKNFLSYGNKWSEYTFKSGITRITGMNGAGKSTIVELVYYALFGKPYRKINLNQMINTINKKGLEVELHLERGGKFYKIVRGLKPKKFEVYTSTTGEFTSEDIIPVNSHVRTYQDFIEEEIIHSNENIANQTLVKSMTKTISFLTLPKGDKRKIIETIIDIAIFSEMTKVAKEAMKKVDEDIIIVRKDINNTDLLIEQEQDNINRLIAIKAKIEAKQKEANEEIETRIVEIEADQKMIEEGFEKIEKFKVKHSKLNAKHSSLRSQQRILNNNIRAIETERNSAEKKMQMLKDVCGDCPKISEIFSAEEGVENDKKLEKLGTEIKSFDVEIEGVDKQLNKLDTIIQNERMLNSKKAQNIKEITVLKGKLKEADEEEMVVINEDKYKEYKEKRKEFEKHYNQLSRLLKHYKVSRTLLDDTGIKTFIIKKYLPHINRLLNTYLQKFQADTLFYFDEEFNEVIGTRFKESFSYDSFSEGQKRRIDLAILFTFLDFCKAKNQKSECNVLFLDEISSGLDAIGENALYDILTDIIRKENKEIITISHSLAIENDKIDRLFEVKLQKGFSVMELVNT